MSSEDTGSGIRQLPTPIDLSHFTCGVTLGTGSFGRVRFAKHNATDTIWAIKMLKKSEIIRLQQVRRLETKNPSFLILFS